MNKGKTIDTREVALSDTEKIFISLCEETLSDGSKVYNVYVMFPSRVEAVHYAESLEKAQELFLKLYEALDYLIIF